MTTIVTRAGKGSALTHTELDNNFTNLNTDKVEASGDSMTGNLSFGDNNKAVFGAGSDLQIYHDGSNSYIEDAGVGNLILKGADIQILASNGDVFFKAFQNNRTELYYDNSEKLRTTSTGIDVTGTVTADGLTVDGDTSTFSGTNYTYAGTNYNIFSYHGTGTGGIRLGADSVTGRGVIGGIGLNNIDVVTYSGTAWRPNMTFHYNGDISFYEDTGTTAKFFWDASAESLGIDNNTPSSTYSIDAGKGIRIISTLPNVTLQESDASSHTWQLGSYGGNFSIRDITHASYPFTVADGGNVGIGETAPNNNLHVTTSTNGGGLTIQRDSITSGDYGQLGFNQTVNSAGTPNLWIRGYRGATFETSYMTFGTGGATGSERMRIDSSGNLLVGTTNLVHYAGSSSQGHTLFSNGTSTHSVNGGEVAILNRQTSDGAIIQLRKDGSTVGSIGNVGSNLYIDGGNTGLYLGSTSIQPKLSGAVSDNAVDIGQAGLRFKNLYLSGGVYLGGTGAANLLDDYEQGTWTPTLNGTTSGSATIGTLLGASYTKIGNLVHVRAYCSNVDLTNGTILGSVKLGGLPFASVSFSGKVNIYYSTLFTASPVTTDISGFLSGTEVTLRQGSSTTSFTDTDLANTTTAQFMVDIIYATTA